VTAKAGRSLDAVLFAQADYGIDISDSHTNFFGGEFTFQS
jgi:hypothetical protein